MASARRKVRAARELLGALAALVVLCSALSALAALPSHAALPVEWQAPASCPGQGALSERLVALLDDQPGLGNVRRVRAVVSQGEAGFGVVLEVTEAERSSTRELSADDCADLLEATALAIALTAHSEPSVTPAAPQLAASNSPALPPDVPGVSGRAAHAVLWSAGAEAVLDTGALPQPAAGLGVLGRARRGEWSLDVHGALFGTQSLDVRGAGRVEFSLLLAGLRGCYWPLSGTTSAGACAGFEAGQLRAAGTGLVPGNELRDLWVAPSVGVTARQLLGRGWQLLFRGEPVLPLQRKQYVVYGSERVHAPASLDVRLSFGLGVGMD